MAKENSFRKSFRSVRGEELQVKEYQERLAEQYNDVGFFDAARAAYERENSLHWFLEGLDTKKHELDTSNWLDNQETFDELTKDIPSQSWDFLEEAVNLEHAKDLRSKTLKSLKNEQTLQSYGWTGLGLRMAAALADPLAVGATVVTEGALAPAVWGNKATRLGNAFRGAISGASANAVVESYLLSQDSVKDPYDIIYGTTAGFLLGGTLGGLRKIPDQEFDDAVAATQVKVEQAQVANMAEQIKRETGVDLTSSVPPDPLSDNVDIPNLASNELTDFSDMPEAPFSVFGDIRFDMVGRGKNSKLNSARFHIGRLGEDGVQRNRNDAIMGETADINKTIIFNVERGGVSDVYNPNFKEYAKERGNNFIERNFSDSRSKFGEEVSDQIEYPKPDVSVNVKKSADAIAQSQARLLGMLKEVGYEGFENIPENLNYFSHLWQSFKFHKMSVNHGRGNLIRLMSKSLTSADSDLTQDLADEIAEGMVKKIERSEYGNDIGIARIFTADERDILKSILVEEEILNQDAAERLVSLFGRQAVGEPARAKRRLKIDTRVELRLEDGSILRVKDLMDRDAERVYDTYVQQMSGLIGLAKVGYKSKRDFEKAVAEVKAEGIAQNLTKEAEAQIQSMNILYDMIRGRNPSDAPLNAAPGSRTAKAARLLSDYSFLRLMNQVGFAQIGEIGNILSIGGVRSLIQVVPELKSLIKRAEDGTLEDQVARDIVTFFGVGNERSINQSFNRFDPAENYVPGGTSKVDRVLDKSIEFTQPLKRFTADLSGMAPITLALQRGAARVAIQTITDAAFESKAISAKRLAGIGLDEDMAERVYKQIRKHFVTVESPVFNNQKVKQSNMDNWDDLEARSAFVVAVNRMVRRGIQSNDLGNLNKYMTGTAGKLVTQFRTFMLVSYSKQTLNGLTYRDMNAAMGFLGSVFFAGTAYVAQTHLNAIGRDDKEEFLKERLSLSSIGKSSFQRSAYASIIPAGIDTIASFATPENVFAYGRTTGLASDAISGIPTVDLGNKLFKVVTGATRAALNEDLQWSQSHQRALNSLLFFQNALGIKNILNLTVEALPESQRVD